MIDKDLKRMFFEEDCSEAERTLLANIRGLTIDECKQEFSRQAKFDFVMRNESFITCIEKGMNGKDYGLLIKVVHLDADDFKLLSLCSNVECEQQPCSFGSWRPMASYSTELTIFVKFIENELEPNQIKQIYDKINSYRQI